MKRILIILIIQLLSLNLYASQQDSVKIAELGSKLQEYYEALKHEPLNVQKNECDFLIESTADSLIRQFVALHIFRHYLESPLMGAENVAVHVYDKWFSDGKVRMKSQADYLTAKVYADFNRQSLLGESAPKLQLESYDGAPVELFADNLDSGKYSVLYFYDTDCAKCKVETIFLKNYFADIDYPVNLFAIYSGDDRDSWEDYIKERFILKPSKVTHLWDPFLESDFQRKYGVIQTPRLFLVSPDGIIIGRGLDVKSLEVMIEGIFGEKTLEYGGEESVNLYDGIFDMSGGRPTENEVKGIADYIHDKTLARGDTLMFRQMAGDYLYYLASHSGEGFKEGLKYHLNKNILGADGVWKSPDDSLKVIGFAEIMEDLLSKASPGTRIPSVKVPGILKTFKGEREVVQSLDKLRGDTNIIIFFTEGCDVCASEKNAASEMLETIKDKTLPKSRRKAIRNTEVYMVNVDEIMASDPALASSLMNLFDLSSLPMIVITDSDGIVIRRYTTLLS